MSLVRRAGGKVPIEQSNGQWALSEKLTGYQNGTGGAVGYQLEQTADLTASGHSHETPVEGVSL